MRSDLFNTAVLLHTHRIFSICSCCRIASVIHRYASAQSSVLQSWGFGTAGGPISVLLYGKAISCNNYIGCALTTAQCNSPGACTGDRNPREHNHTKRDLLLVRAILKTRHKYVRKLAPERILRCEECRFDDLRDCGMLENLV